MAIVLGGGVISLLDQESERSRETVKERPQRNRPTKSRFLSDGDWLKKHSFIPGFYSFEMADLNLPSVNVCLRLGFWGVGLGLVPLVFSPRGGTLNSRGTVGK